MTVVETLVGDIYKLLTNKTAKASLIPENYASLVNARLTDETRDRAQVLRLSAVAYPARKLWYKTHVRELEEPIPPHTLFKFLYGDLIEETLLALAEEAGHSVTDRQKLVTLNGVEGHIDGIIDGVLIDCKSASTYSFREFANGNIFFNDPFGYVGQLTAYAQALGMSRAGWLVADKTLGHICFVEIPSDILTRVDYSVRISELRIQLSDTEKVPERCYEDEPYGKSGNHTLSVNCSYCGFKKHCWRDANDGKGLRTFIYSSGPVFLTKVHREPNVVEVTESND